MNLSIVVATGLNGEIGKDNHLLWNLSSDLKRFKEITTKVQKRSTKNVVIMGRNTFESLPFKYGLPNRINAIISSNLDMFTEKEYEEYDIDVFNSVESICTLLKNCAEEVFIIGGASIYKQFLPYCNKIYLTEVQSEFEADTFFKFNKDEFNVENESELMEENNLKFKFIDLVRK